MPLFPRRTTSFLLCILLAACGGGSDSPPATNSQPASSGGTASGGDTPAAPGTAPGQSGGTGGSGDAGNTTGSTPSAPSSGDGGAGTGNTAFQVDATARFNLPSDIVADDTGTLYVMDRGNQAIRKIATNGDVSTLPGSVDARSKLAIGPSGQLFMLTGIDIYRVAADGGKTLVKSYPQSPGSYAPLDIAADSQGRIYVLQEYRNIFRVSRINADNSETGVYYVNAYGSVTGIASDAAGNLAIGVSAAGGPAVAADGSGIAFSHVDFVPLAAQSDASAPSPGVVHLRVDDLYVSGKMAFDAGGNILMTGARYDAATTAGKLRVTDMRVGRLQLDGTVITVLNGFPDGDNTPREIAADMPARPGIAVAKTGELYLSDPFDQAIYRIGASGAPTLVAGKPGEAGNAD